MPGFMTLTLLLFWSLSSKILRRFSGAGRAARGTSSKLWSAMRFRIRSSIDAVTSSVGCGGGLTALSKSRSTSRALFNGLAPARKRHVLVYGLAAVREARLLIAL